MSLLIPIVLVGAVVAAGSWMARRLKISDALVLFVLGGAIGFIPDVGSIRLAPELVLSLFLPALLYWEASTTSLREIRHNLRVVVLLAVGLVVATAVAVGAVASWLGLPWPIALLLGTIVAPTDATAVSSATHDLPRRTGVTLRAESLFNDAAALALYGVAVGAVAAGGTLNPALIGAEFVWAAVVGLGFGIAVGFAGVALRRTAGAGSLGGTIGVLSPLAAFLTAELVGGSGVVAAVVCGLTVAQRSSRSLPAASRRQAYGFWQITSFGLTGSLFVLTGLQLHTVVASWPAEQQLPVAAIAAAVTGTVIVVRLIWFNTVPYLIRVFDRRPSQRARRSPFRQRLPLAWAGMRGAVSLAAALSVPTVTDSGAAFPQRAVLITVTFAVITATIVIQGPTFGAVVRLAGFPPDDKSTRERRLALRTIYGKALEELPTVARDLGAPDDVRDALQLELQELRDHLLADESGPAPRDEVYWIRELRRRLIPIEREALLELRTSRHLDDQVVRVVQAHLDSKELALDARDDDDA